MWRIKSTNKIQEFFCSSGKGSVNYVDRPHRCEYRSGINCLQLYPAGGASFLLPSPLRCVQTKPSLREVTVPGEHCSLWGRACRRVRGLVLEVWGNLSTGPLWGAVDTGGCCCFSIFSYTRSLALWLMLFTWRTHRTKLCSPEATTRPPCPPSGGECQQRYNFHWCLNDCPYKSAAGVPVQDCWALYLWMCIHE